MSKSGSYHLEDGDFVLLGGLAICPGPLKRFEVGSSDQFEPVPSIKLLLDSGLVEEWHNGQNTIHYRATFKGLQLLYGRLGAHASWLASSKADEALALAS